MCAHFLLLKNVFLLPLDTLGPRAKLPCTT